MLRIAKSRSAPNNLSFVLADAECDFDGSPFDAICAFQVLLLVDNLSGRLAHIRAQLKPGSLLITKTWCFADMGLGQRALFGGLRAAGLLPRARPVFGIDSMHAGQAGASIGD